MRDNNNKGCVGGCEAGGCGRKGKPLDGNTREKGIKMPADATQRKSDTRDEICRTKDNGNNNVGNNDEQERDIDLKNYEKKELNPNESKTNENREQQKKNKTENEEKQSEPAQINDNSQAPSSSLFYSVSPSTSSSSSFSSCPAVCPPLSVESSGGGGDDVNGCELNGDGESRNNREAQLSKTIEGSKSSANVEISKEEKAEGNIAKKADKPSSIVPLKDEENKAGRATADSVKNHTRGEKKRDIENAPEEKKEEIPESDGTIDAAATKKQEQKSRSVCHDDKGEALAGSGNTCVEAARAGASGNSCSFFQSLNLSSSSSAPASSSSSCPPFPSSSSSSSFSSCSFSKDSSAQGREKMSQNGKNRTNSRNNEGGNSDGENNKTMNSSNDNVSNNKNSDNNSSYGRRYHSNNNSATSYSRMRRYSHNNNHSNTSTHRKASATQETASTNVPPPQVSSSTLHPSSYSSDVSRNTSNPSFNRSAQNFYKKQKQRNKSSDEQKTPGGGEAMDGNRRSSDSDVKLITDTSSSFLRVSSSSDACRERTSSNYSYDQNGKNSNYGCKNRRDSNNNRNCQKDATCYQKGYARNANSGNMRSDTDSNNVGNFSNNSNNLYDKLACDRRGQIYNSDNVSNRNMVCMPAVPVYSSSTNSRSYGNSAFSCPPYIPTSTYMSASASSAGAYTSEHDAPETVYPHSYPLPLPYNVQRNKIVNDCSWHNSMHRYRVNSNELNSNNCNSNNSSDCSNNIRSSSTDKDVHEENNKCCKNSVNGDAQQNREDNSSNKSDRNHKSNNHKKNDNSSSSSCGSSNVSSPAACGNKTGDSNNEKKRRKWKKRKNKKIANNSLSNNEGDGTSNYNNDENRLTTNSNEPDNSSNNNSNAPSNSTSNSNNSENHKSKCTAAEKSNNDAMEKGSNSLNRKTRNNSNNKKKQNNNNKTNSNNDENHLDMNDNHGDSNDSNHRKSKSEDGNVDNNDSDDVHFDGSSNSGDRNVSSNNNSNGNKGEKNDNKKRSKSRKKNRTDAEQNSEDIKDGASNKHSRNSENARSCGNSSNKGDDESNVNDSINSYNTNNSRHNDGSSTNDGSRNTYGNRTGGNLNNRRRSNYANHNSYMHYGNAAYNTNTNVRRQYNNMRNTNNRINTYGQNNYNNSGNYYYNNQSIADYNNNSYNSNYYDNYYDHNRYNYGNYNNGINLNNFNEYCYSNDFLTNNNSFFGYNNQNNTNNPYFYNNMNNYMLMNADYTNNNMLNNYIQPPFNFMQASNQESCGPSEGQFAAEGGGKKTEKSNDSSTNAGAQDKPTRSSPGKCDSSLPAFPASMPCSTGGISKATRATDRRAKSCDGGHFDKKDNSNDTQSPTDRQKRSCSVSAFAARAGETGNLEDNGEDDTTPVSRTLYHPERTNVTKTGGSYSSRNQQRRHFTSNNSHFEHDNSYTNRRKTQNNNFFQQQLPNVNAEVYENANVWNNNNTFHTDMNMQMNTFVDTSCNALSYDYNSSYNHSSGYNNSSNNRSAGVASNYGASYDQSFSGQSQFLDNRTINNSNSSNMAFSQAPHPPPFSPLPPFAADQGINKGETNESNNSNLQCLSQQQCIEQAVAPPSSAASLSPYLSALPSSSTGSIVARDFLYYCNPAYASSFGNSHFGNFFPPQNVCGYDKSNCSMNMFPNMDCADPSNSAFYSFYYQPCMQTQAFSNQNFGGMENSGPLSSSFYQQANDLSYTQYPGSLQSPGVSMAAPPGGASNTFSNAPYPYNNYSRNNFRASNRYGNNRSRQSGAGARNSIHSAAAGAGMHGTSSDLYNSNSAFNPYMQLQYDGAAPAAEANSFLTEEALQNQGIFDINAQQDYYANVNRSAQQQQRNPQQPWHASSGMRHHNRQAFSSSFYNKFNNARNYNKNKNSNNFNGGLQQQRPFDNAANLSGFGGRGGEDENAGHGEQQPHSYRSNNNGGDLSSNPNDKYPSSYVQRNNKNRTHFTRQKNISGIGATDWRRNSQQNCALRHGGPQEGEKGKFKKHNVVDMRGKKRNSTGGNMQGDYSSSAAVSVSSFHSVSNAAGGRRPPRGAGATRSSNTTNDKAAADAPNDTSTQKDLATLYYEAFPSLPKK